MSDPFTMLHVSSDPVVSSHRKPEAESQQVFDVEVDALLVSHPDETRRTMTLPRMRYESASDKSEDSEDADDESALGLTPEERSDSPLKFSLPE